MSLDQNSIKETHESLEMTYYWYETPYTAGCVFFLIWDFLAIAMFYTELGKLFSGQMGPVQSAFAFLVFIALLVIPTYWMLMLRMNRTVVRLSRKEVAVWHGPLPWRHINCRFDFGDLKYIWILEKEDDPDEDDPELRNVMAMLKNGETRDLIVNMPDPEESRIVRDTIHKWMRAQHDEQQKVPQRLAA